MKVKVKVKVTVKVTVKVKAAGPRVGSLAQRRVSGGRSLLIAVVVQAAARAGQVATKVHLWLSQAALSAVA